MQWADNVGKSMFEQKGIIVATVPEGSTGDPMEKAVDDAIECGAEEVEPTDQTGELVVSFKTLFGTACSSHSYSNILLDYFQKYFTF